MRMSTNSHWTRSLKLPIQWPIYLGAIAASCAVAWLLHWWLGYSYWASWAVLAVFGILIGLGALFHYFEDPTPESDNWFDRATSTLTGKILAGPFIVGGFLCMPAMPIRWNLIGLGLVGIFGLPLWLLSETRIKSKPTISDSHANDG